MRNHETTEPMDADVPSAIDAELGNFFEGKFAEAMDNVPPELIQLSEEELHQKVSPSSTDWRLRQNLSSAVKEAEAMGYDHIETQRIYDGVITRQAFHYSYMPNPLKVAWMIRPIVDHRDFYNAIHQEALNKIFEMVRSTPVDPKYLPQILKLAETAGNRVHGPVVQRLQVQSRNVNVEMSARQAGIPDDQDALKLKIEEMQKKLIEAPRDVSSKEENEV